MTKEKKRILIIGNIKITLNIIKSLIKKNNIVGVVSSKKKNINADFADIAGYCKKHKILSYSSNDINDKQTYSWITKRKPDYIMCFGWSRLIKGKLLKNYRNKIIGLHPAKLPNNRGRHPLIWPIVLGLKKSAVTFFLINNKVDAGKILDQKNFKIYEGDTASSIYKRASNIIVKRVPLILKKMSSIKKIGNLKNDQKNTEVGNIWRKRNFADGIIDWRMSAKTIVRLVNALSKPYVGAEFIYKKKSIKVWKAEEIKNKKLNNIEYGKVIKKTQNGFIVKCLEDLIHVKKFSPKINIKVGEYL